MQVNVPLALEEAIAIPLASLNQPTCAMQAMFVSQEQIALDLQIVSQGMNVNLVITVLRDLIKVLSARREHTVME